MLLVNSGGGSNCGHSAFDQQDGHDQTGVRTRRDANSRDRGFADESAWRINHRKV